MRFDLNETQQAYEQTKDELENDLARIVEIESELEDVTPELDSALELAAESAAILEEAECGLRQWQTEWDEFKHYDWNAIANDMKKPAQLFDRRNIIAWNHKFDQYYIGK